MSKPNAFDELISLSEQSGTSTPSTSTGGRPMHEDLIVYEKNTIQWKTCGKMHVLLETSLEHRKSTPVVDTDSRPVNSELQSISEASDDTHASSIRN